MEDITNNPQLKLEDSVSNQHLENSDETTASKLNNALLVVNSSPSNIDESESSKAVYLNENDDIDCLPGYRFNPFDHELIVYYLRNKVMKMALPHNKIKEIELYKYNPEEITKKEQGLVDKEWYFFTPRDRKYKNGSRPNRAAGNGYWKATGADKNVYDKGVIVGHRKALVFYEGKAPKGDKTNWIMHEFRIDEKKYTRKRTSEHDMRLDDWVLCRIYKKDDKHRKAPKHNHNRNRSENSDDISSPLRESEVPPPATTENAVPPYSNFRRGNPSPLIIGNGHRNNGNLSPLSVANGHRTYGNPMVANCHRNYGNPMVANGNHLTGFRGGNDLPLMMNDQYHYTDQCFHNNPVYTNPCYRYVSQPFPHYEEDNFENFEHEDWSVEPLLDNFNDNSHMENLDTMFLSNNSHNEVIVVQNNNSQMQTPPSHAGSSS